MNSTETVLSVVGARPQFIKLYPLVEALSQRKIRHVILHTGQHYDVNMSQLFFEELRLPEPDVNLNVGSGSHAEQTAKIMVGVERYLLELRPKTVVIFGDTNSSLAAALAAAKLYVPIIHIESGVRSLTRHMPEEINRRLIDHISETLVCPSDRAVANLAREGITDGVGNFGDFMYDTFLFAKSVAGRKPPAFLAHGVAPRGFLLTTLHRELTTGSAERLSAILDALAGWREPVILPMHPRTRAQLKAAGVTPESRGALKIVQPLGYLEMLSMLLAARKVVTDSGGLQKEAYWAGVPCITLMPDTTWVETVDAGWNKLVGLDVQKMVNAIADEFPLDLPRPEVYGAPGAAERLVTAMGWE